MIGAGQPTPGAIRFATTILIFHTYDSDSHYHNGYYENKDAMNAYGE
jgi:hypothetical protein